MAIYFGGSRDLTSSSVLSQVVGAVLASGQSVHVGCSVGADALVIRSVLRSSLFQQARVFAAFAQSGAGEWSGSSSIVHQFARAGGSVQWLAGGGLQVPLAGRLIQRSIKALAGCSVAVFFQPGSGSLAVASHAVAAGIPVYAFSQSAPAAPQGCAGSWGRLSASAVCSSLPSFVGVHCWRWSSAQPSLF